ncbi:unnamed protein product [Pleuronectes platessa]|uniref:Uncharacterized protein n=1 Tax=Pleuronectes platessa TaxID=8262 RepID=A0A9N7Z327_PLEPL|nr:unnamed protein product [Pleuronectes platessa]
MKDPNTRLQTPSDKLPNTGLESGGGREPSWFQEASPQRLRRKLELLSLRGLRATITGAGAAHTFRRKLHSSCLQTAPELNREE